MPYHGVGKCRRCGVEGQKNLTRGMCPKCYKRVWYKKFMNAERRKKQKDKVRFGGIREEVMKRDGHACVDCGSTESQLAVHHKDGKGHRDGDSKRNSEVNNNPDNLVTLCYKCHKRRHDRNNMWSRKHKLSACRVCGSAEYKHNAHGMCKRCYDLSRVPHTGRSFVDAACIVCGTTERKHHGHGMCARCAQQALRCKKKQ